MKNENRRTIETSGANLNLCIPVVFRSRGAVPLNSGHTPGIGIA